jgi:hypothetical protein
MLLTHDETCDTLRQLTASRAITAWTHRDCMLAKCDIYTIVFNPGNVPLVVEWTQARVERWLRSWLTADEILGSL